MAHPSLRVLLLADTHLGFDDPARPRVVRRRRGPDFFACYERALRPALRREVDLVVHGGDVFYRARVPPSLVRRAMEPLLRVAELGVPVLVVPGNHERSRIPFPLLARHPLLHVFDVPRTVRVDARGVRVALSGFPFARVVDGPAFAALLSRTRWREHDADVRLLCIHQSVEGARVGAHDFTFRRGPDVVPGAAIPHGFAAVLSGHIHRAQVLVTDLAGAPLAAPVLYPGSIERTSYAERFETKGYVTLRIAPGPDGGRLVERLFHPLPARPMHLLELDVDGVDALRLRRHIAARLAGIEPDAVVRVAADGVPRPDAAALLSAPALRTLAPETMTIEVAPPRERFERRRTRAAR